MREVRTSLVGRYLFWWSVLEHESQLALLGLFFTPNFSPHRLIYYGNLYHHTRTRKSFRKAAAEKRV